MTNQFDDYLQQELAAVRGAGLYKNERVITSPQGASVQVEKTRDVLNFCANSLKLRVRNYPILKTQIDNLSGSFGERQQ